MAFCFVRLHCRILKSMVPIVVVLMGLRDVERKESLKALDDVHNNENTDPH